MQNTGVGGWISTLSEWQPQAPVITFKGRRINWQEFGQKVDGIAAGLAAAGINKGDRVACLMHNRPEYLELFWACMRIGAIFCPVNVRLASSEMAYIFSDLKPSILVSEPSFLEKIAEIGSDTRIGRVVLTEAAKDYSCTLETLASADLGHLPADRPASQDIATILYTSGTTGLPKGAIISHGNVQAQATNFATVFGLTASDIQLMFSPLCFTGGLMSACMNTFLTGSSMIMTEGFNADEAIEIIHTQRPTWLSGVPFMFQRIFEHPHAPETDFSCLRVMIVGGAPLPTALEESIRKRGLEAIQVYALTESSGGINLSVPRGLPDGKLGSVGKPSILGMARVINNNNIDCAPGEVGELILSGPMVFQGYWNNEEATSQTIQNGWLRTGDLAQRDEDGFYYITGRKKEMIITGGLNVYPTEVENAISLLEGVAEVAVVGIPDPVWGEAIVAAIILHPGASLSGEDIRNHARQFIADYKVPKQVRFLEDFPRTTSNKVLKRVLVEKISAAM